MILQKSFGAKKKKVYIFICIPILTESSNEHHLFQNTNLL